MHECSWPALISLHTALRHGLACAPRRKPGQVPQTRSPRTLLHGRSSQFIVAEGRPQKLMRKATVNARPASGYIDPVTPAEQE